MRAPRNVPALFVVTVLVLGVGVIVWDIVAPRGSGALVQVTVPALSRAAQAGKAAFDRNCMECHGEDGAGTDKGPPLVHDIYQPGHHDDASFFRAVRNGVPSHHWRFGDMPPQPEVTDRTVAVVVQYIRELQVANGIVWRPHRM